MSLLLLPPKDLYSQQEREHSIFPVYSYYNYLRPGAVSLLKRRRLEQALALARPWFWKGSAIDYGCADGIFLPSLSSYFNYVVGVDIDPNVVEIANELCRRMPLSNVSVICNVSAPEPEQLVNELQGREYNVAFLLEMLYQVGDKPDIYSKKFQLLESLLRLLTDDGVIIISVPKMIGIPFLLKYVAQASTGMVHERYSLKELLKSSLLGDTDSLEASYIGGRKGFNHVKLEKGLREHFRIVARKEMFFSLLYVIGRTKHGAERKRP